MGKRSVGVSVATQTSIEIAFTYRGRPCRERVKLPPTRDNLTHCRRWRESILHQIAIGTFTYRRHFPHSLRAAWFGERSAEGMTVAQLLDQWMAAMSVRVNKPLSKAGRMSYESAIRVHWRPRFGPSLIDSLSADQVREFLADLKVSPKTQNNLLTPLRGAYQLAFEQGLIDKNPLDRVSAATVERRDPDPFTVAEIRAILEACADPQHQALFQFAFATGLRPSEYIALLPGDVDWGQRIVRVERARVRGEIKAPKTAAGRRKVDLFPPAIMALTMVGAGPGSGRPRWPGPGPVPETLFYDPETGAHWTGDGPIRKAWTAILKRAGVRYRSPKQTRHTFACMMLSAGEDPTYLAYLMGHADWGPLRKVYARWIPGVQTDAGSRGAAALAALGGEA